MGWIKVSERKPDEYMEVLVTVPKYKQPDKRVAVACYYDADEGKFCWWNGYDDCEEEVSDVIAWMPFPEPYSEA